jgi:uncharacterized protein YdeI (YjbR/CyaY-like superfamily)
MDVTFFETPYDLRRWFEQNHDKIAELWIGFHKNKTKRASVTYQEALDQALCFGWVDGVRKAIDDNSYMIRFTPRKPDSQWSMVNIKRAHELSQQGLMHPIGLKAFEARDEEKSKQYSYEARSRGLDAAYEKRLTENEKAWAFFQAQPLSYQRVASWWVMSAKKEGTRLKRLATLIEDSAQGRRVSAVIYTPKR